MHFQVFSSRLTPTIISLFILVAFWTSRAQYDEQFSECSTRAFNCGQNIQNTGYPFWGDNRPKFCGHPQLELSCQNNDHATIVINTQTFRVLEINQSMHRMTLARLDLWDDHCLQTFSNISLNNTLFGYSPTVRILNIFYGCTPNTTINNSILEVQNNFTCAADRFREHGGFYVDESFLRVGLENNTSCEIGIEVPILMTSLDGLRNGLVQLQEALNLGFELVYSADNVECSSCEDSDGICGSDPISNQFVCLCGDQPYSALCQHHVHRTLSVGLNSGLCVPKNCGNGPNISYPFWIPDEQESYCGSSGFQITCNSNNPVLAISDDDYVIKEIIYTNHSFLLANAAAFDSGTTCPIPLHNFSINHTPFSYGPSYWDLFFFYNCTSPANEYGTYSVDCASNATHHSFAVFHSELLEFKNYSIESCQSVVNAPVDADDLNKFLEMSFTDILKAGFVLQWNAVNCSNCENSGGICGSHNDEFACFCNDQPHLNTCNNDKKVNWGLKLGIGASTVGIGILMTCIIICCFRSRTSSYKSIKFWEKKTNDDNIIEACIKQNGSLAPKRYSYSEVKKMTNFLRDKLGQGGYGSVHRGKLFDGRPVAVKILNGSKGNGEEFINEVSSISRTSHVNIVSLLGFCFDGHDKRALIYEFMPNGSLEKFIYSEGPLKASGQLGWEKLYQIAIGIARGLEYLHRGCNTRILHFDIKPHNILLDEDFCPKISDFGLAKLCPKKDSIISMLGARGTIGYIAPEVLCRNFGGVSHKSDVYSYGMMILEMVGGRKNIDVGVSHTSEIYFPHWIYKRLELDEDLGLQGDTIKEENEIARKMIIVGLWCIQTDPSQRPSISTVMDMLEGSMEALKIPPKPFLGSPARPVVNSSTISIIL
ncbi:hypothetical protein F0562_023884 [Nyssa sinensis]|uniref:non-specific serine/threonine protein kinase n=1 Tax=Nyssa sinensis TaxID=561372 RepID=A0A5J5BLY7_9ASTE|nr:hypothetical protein F0562_023884 [Nyssa sinensis]